MPITSATALRSIHTLKMSPASTGDSPHSGAGGMTATSQPTVRYPLQSREGFSIEIPSPQVNATNGGNALKSPTSLKSARAASFSREGILGSAQKARNLSQSSDNRPETLANGMQNGQQSDDGGINPLKRRNTSAEVDYPRRRATIAVRVDRFTWNVSGAVLLERCVLTVCLCSVKYAARASRGATELNPSASFVLSWVLSASTESQESSWMPETSSFSSG